MSRTRRIGWTAITDSDSDNRGIKHHAHNDWFSKKNACRGPNTTPKGDDSWGEYWGRDKAKVKQITRRRARRQLNEEFLYED
jgi:hypothetical protein